MKVKLLFGLHAPVDPGFLEKCKGNADFLKVDEFQRIIVYTDKKRGLKLRGRHKTLIYLDETTETKLLKFLVEKSKTVDTPFVGSSFLRVFKSSTGNSSTIDSLKRRYDLFKKKLFRFSNFDKNTHIKMLFVSSAEIPRCFLRELQKDATVVVDEKGRITKYEAHDGSLMLNGDHSLSSKIKLSCSERWNSIRRKLECDKNEDSGTDTDTDNDNVYEREMSQLIKFVVERAKSVNTPMNVRNMCEDFKRLSGSSNELPCLWNRVKRFGEKIPRMDEFDQLSKVRMLFALSTRVPDKFLNELRKDADVQVDRFNRIIRYQANDGTLSLEGEHSQSAKQKLASVARKKKIATRAENDEVSDEEEEEEEEGEAERKKKKATKRKTAERENGKRSKVDLLRNVSESDEDETETSSDESDESEDSDVSEMEEIDESHKRRREERSSSSRRVDYDAHLRPVTRNRTKQSMISIQNKKTRTTTKDVSDEVMTGEFELEQDVSRVERIVDDFEYDDPRDFDSSEGQSEEVITETDMLTDRNADGSGPSISGKGVVRTSICHSAEEGDDFKPDVNSAQTENKEDIVECSVNGEKDEDGRGNKDSISRKVILESLHTLLLTLELSSLESVQKRVETMLEEAKNNDDDTLQVHGALIALDTFLYMSMKEAAMKCPPGTESISLKEFLTVLRIVIIFIKSKGLLKFTQKLKVMIAELSIQDKIIPVESITAALETTLNIISS